LHRRSQEKLRSYLPRFGFLVILSFVVFTVFVIVFAVELVIIVVIRIVVSIVLHAVARHCIILAHYAPAFGSGTGFDSPAGLGGGYVDQKWRPHFGHTQNWSGVQAIPGPGSRISISAPQR
jgi:hypothetical protein